MNSPLLLQSNLGNYQSENTYYDFIISLAKELAQVKLPSTQFQNQTVTNVTNTLPLEETDILFNHCIKITNLNKTAKRTLSRRTPKNPNYPSVRPFFLVDNRNKLGKIYLVFIVTTKRKKKIKDVRFFRSYKTLKKLVKYCIKKGYSLLVHPYPIKIPKGFFPLWKRANTPDARKQLIRNFGIAKDENVYEIDKIILDIDIHHSISLIPVISALKSLGDFYFECYVTPKSGNLRVIIPFREVTTITLKKGVVDPQPDVEVKVFYKVNGERLRQFKEALRLFYDYLSSKGVYPDRSFLRINHPIWYVYNGKIQVGKSFCAYRNVVNNEEAPKLSFYDFINLVKKKCRIDTVDPSNLLTSLEKVPKIKIKTKQDASYSNVLARWKKAVRTLLRKYPKGGRYIHVIQPATGWAKYLEEFFPGFIEEAEAFLCEVMPDKARDIKIGFKYSKKLTFNFSEKVTLSIDGSVDCVEEVKANFSRYVKMESVSRQELIKNVFLGQVWLCDLVMNKLVEKELYEATIKKNGKRGRPAKIFVRKEKDLKKIIMILDNIITRLGGSYLHRMGGSGQGQLVSSQSACLPRRQVVLTEPTKKTSCFSRQQIVTELTCQPITTELKDQPVVNQLKEQPSTTGLTETAETEKLTRLQPVTTKLENQRSVSELKNQQIVPWLKDQPITTELENQRVVPELKNQHFTTKLENQLVVTELKNQQITRQVLTRLKNQLN